MCGKWVKLKKAGKIFSNMRDEAIFLPAEPNAKRKQQQKIAVSAVRRMK